MVSLTFSKVSMQELIGIDISISIGPMIIKCGKQVHQQDLFQIALIKQVLEMSLRQGNATN